MGVYTTCNLTFFNAEKQAIQRIELDGYVDSFIYSLVNDGGAEFAPETFADFTAEEREAAKIYFDKISHSVMEDLATVTPNLQEPKKLLSVWAKVEASLHAKQNPAVGIASQILNLLQIAADNGLWVEITVADF